MSKSLAVAAVVFFVVVYTSFMYGLFLLFIAILLENFDTTDAEKEDIQRAALRIRVMKASPTSQIAHLNSEDQSCHGLVDWCFF